MKAQLAPRGLGEQPVEVPKLDKDVEEAMLEVQRKHQRDYNGIEHKYMKGTDINKFRNYKAVIDGMTAKRCEN